VEAEAGVVMQLAIIAMGHRAQSAVALAPVYALARPEELARAEEMVEMA